MKYVKHLLLLLISVNSLSVFATHIVGGSIRYQHLGSGVYRIILTAYRDCYNGIAPFDDPAVLGVFDHNGILLKSLSVSHGTVQTVAGSTSNCLPFNPGNICYEKTEYSVIDTLPPVNGGYTISYQRCCRPSYVVNVAVATGATYVATIPDSILANNDSPEFLTDPLTFLCVNDPFVYNNSAVDIDGDSISYSLYTPLDGASQANPMPQPPAGPPYSDMLRH